MDFKLLMENCLDPDLSEASWFWCIFLKEGNAFWKYKVAWDMKNTISTPNTRNGLALLVRVGKLIQSKLVKQNRIIWAILVRALYSKFDVEFVTMEKMCKSSTFNSQYLAPHLIGGGERLGSIGGGFLGKLHDHLVCTIITMHMYMYAKCDKIYHVVQE